MINIPKHKRLVLFDGVCNLCNSSIIYIIKNDRHNTFLFTPLQSKIGKDLINKYNIDTAKVDSILLFNPSKGIRSKSSAILAIVSRLGFPQNLLAIFYIIPPFIRNWVYSFIAKNRYTWFGKKESCMVPTPELKAKFLE